MLVGDVDIGAVALLLLAHAGERTDFYARRRSLELVLVLTALRQAIFETSVDDPALPLLLALARERVAEMNEVLACPSSSR